MKAIRSLAMGCMAWVAVAAQAEGGLQVRPEQAPWPRWQARVGLDLAPGWRGGFSSAEGHGLRGARVLGDVYLSGPGFGAGRLVGGLRATGGVLLGGGSGAPSLLASTAGAPLSLSITHGVLPGRLGEEALEAPPVGYLGIGYSGLSLRGGWGFSADVGLMTGNGGLRPPGASAGARSSLDDAVRELRLRPVLQLGVSYAF